MSIASCRRIDCFQIKKLWQIGFTLSINYHPKTLLEIKPIRKNTQSNKAFPKKKKTKTIRVPLQYWIFFRAFNLISYSLLRILFIYSAKLQQFKNVIEERGKERLMTNNNLLGQYLHVRHSLDKKFKNNMLFHIRFHSYCSPLFTFRFLFLFTYQSNTYLEWFSFLFLIRFTLNILFTVSNYTISCYILQLAS